MRLILFALFSFALTTTYCQIQQTLFVSKDTTVFPPKNNNIDKMPNSMAGKNPGFVYLGNNAKGFELYKSKVDNMIVLKPDGSFYDNMGNALNQQTQPLKVYRSGLTTEQIDSLTKSGGISLDILPPNNTKQQPEKENNSVLDAYKRVGDLNNMQIDKSQLDKQLIKPRTKN